jgi:hypothetical protein
MHALHFAGRSLTKTVSLCVLILSLGVVASAYTVVMRGGQRIEIPAKFVTTASTLTYEVSPGIQITINVAAIDISATERANNERPGSFLRRIDSVVGKPQSSAFSIGQASRRTITNRDLESSMLRRRESEFAYEKRRKELGLPPLEESRRQAAATSDLISKELEQTRDAERGNESYWRARASSLRTEIAAVDAELAYVRRQLEEPSFTTSNSSFTTVISTLPFTSFGNFGHRPSPFGRPQRPGIFVNPQRGPQLTGRVGFGGVITRGRVFMNPLAFPHSRPFGLPLLAPPNITLFSSGLAGYDFSYERSALITRFNELAATRAGLSARWRELEDEARRAGAPPGWLRP